MSEFRGWLLASPLDLFVVAATGATVSVDSLAVSVEDLDVDDDLLKSTGCVCCCTGFVDW